MIPLDKHKLFAVAVLVDEPEQGESSAAGGRPGKSPMVRCALCNEPHGSHAFRCRYYRKTYAVKCGSRYTICLGCGHATGNQHAERCPAYPRYV